jgi:hypothetical protein
MSLINNKCYSPNVVSFTYVLDKDYTKFLNDANITDFTDLLSNEAVVDLDKIVILDIQKGSTKIIGLIYASTPQSAQRVYKRLQDAKLAGYILLSYNISYNG